MADTCLQSPDPAGEREHNIRHQRIRRTRNGKSWIYWAWKYGLSMAENMLATFGNLTVYNRSQKKAEILQMKGAKIAHSPMEVADSSHVIILSLPGPAEVEEIVAGPAWILSSGRTGIKIIDTSTISPITSEKMYRLCKEQGIYYVDCPVSGGPAGAAVPRLRSSIITLRLQHR